MSGLTFAPAPASSAVDSPNDDAALSAPLFNAAAAACILIDSDSSAAAAAARRRQLPALGGAVTTSLTGGRGETGDPATYCCSVCGDPGDFAAYRCFVDACS